jgi:hypothetical protein
LYRYAAGEGMADAGGEALAPPREVSDPEVWGCTSVCVCVLWNYKRILLPDAAWKLYKSNPLDP